MGSFLEDDEDAYTEAIKAECARARLDWDPSKVEIYHFEEYGDWRALPGEGALAAAKWSTIKATK